MVLSMNRSTEGKFYIFVFYTFFINSLPAIDEISRQLRVNASPPLTSFYGNPCSRYITVRKALAHVLNELRDFRVRHSKMIGITQKKSVDHITLK